MRLSSRTIVVTATGLWPVQALACTLCDGAQAVSIRARLLQTDLWFNLCAVLFPIALLASIIAIVGYDRGDRSGLR